jgi:DHA1 family multidrug resistance protein-like MFS transporter
MGTYNRLDKWILFGVLAAVMMAYGLVMPIFPTFIESMGGGGRDLGLMMAAFSITQLIFSPIWGNLSDAIGRKPVLIFGLAGTALSLALYGQCTQLWMFYGARALSGALASSTFPTAMAYISDTTSERERGAGMGMVSAAMYVGMMAGPSLSGWMAGLRLTLGFYVGAALCALLVVVVLLFLPESLAAERRTGNAGVKVLGGPDFGEMWRALHGPLGYLMFLSFLISFGLNCFWSIFGMYALQRYGFGPGPVGTIMAFIGVGSAAVQLFLTGLLTQRWGETTLIRFSLAASAVGFGVMLLAGDFYGLLVTASLFVMANSLIRPLVTTLISKMAVDGQGKAMGLNNSFMSMGQIVGPTWSGFALDLDVALPFLSGGVVMLFSWITAYFGFSRKRPSAVV